MDLIVDSGLIVTSRGRMMDIRFDVDHQGHDQSPLAADRGSSEQPDQRANFRAWARLPPSSFV